ncbi:MAG: cadmium-translocating P-type ATPase [Sphaerochaetaceae bacterium]|nr:cadmium-translocating P-type ATPase [Sphaerochaetaceae bacterium]
MKTYQIEGLDCASCAIKIETALKRLDGFEDATVSFATQSVSIPSRGVDQAQKIVKRIEPGAHIVLPEAKKEEGRLHSELFRILASAVLLASGLIAEHLVAGSPVLLRWILFLSAYLVVGYTVFTQAIQSSIRGRIFDEMFLMSIATVGALLIGQLEEAVGVMLFYAVGEWVQGKAVRKSRRSIAALTALRPDSARVVVGRTVREMNPQDVQIGSLIQVRSGERVPLDGVIQSGSSRVDTSALTGESVPRVVQEGDEILSGFIIDGGTVQVRVTKRYEQTEVARILTLVEDAANKKAPTERFISRFAAVYTPIIVFLSLSIAFVPPLITGDPVRIWIYRALVLLVISCPCALVISVPLGYFGGISLASKKGILMKGASSIDALKKLDTVVFDKTGTLTRGEFSVVRIVPEKGIEEHTLLLLAATAEAHSSHPIAESIRKAYAETYPELEITAYETYNEQKGFGVEAERGSERLLAGSRRFLMRERISVEEVNSSSTLVHVARNGEYLGYIEIADELKEGALKGIRKLRKAGVRQIVLLSGDREAQVASVASSLSVDTWYSQLLPHEKVEKVEELLKSMKKGKTLAFVGDGVNDAPVLMRSDIGIAMGALGSDAAIEAADIVLMDDRVEGVSEAVRIAHRTRKIVIQNIIFALLVKLAFLSFGAFGIATMWEAVIADVGVALAAVLNATRTLRLRR